jgi:hypothetical protein
MVSPAEGWAVGQSDSSMGSMGAILHYSGGVWTSVPSPRGPALLDSIAMVSPTNGWAGSESGLIQYNGSSWQRVQTPADSPNMAFITGIAVHSPTDVWVLGNVIEHYNGSAWQTIPDQPGPGLLRGVSMTSATDGWAVGGDSGRADIHRFSDGRWQQVDSPTDAPLWAIAMDSPSDGWAVGAGVILHYTGGAWRVIPGPIDVHGA